MNLQLDLLTNFDKACNAAEPLVPEPSCSEAEISTKKVKRYTFPGTDQFQHNCS
jgi:hypothetical protein